MESPTRPSPPPFEPMAALNPRILWQRRQVLFFFVAVSLAAGVLYLAFAPRSYQVTARLLVESRGEVLTTGREEPRERDFLPTQAEIIRSPAVIQTALNRVDRANLRGLGLSPSSGGGVLDWGRMAWRQVAGEAIVGQSADQPEAADLHEVHRPELPSRSGSTDSAAPMRSPFDGSIESVVSAEGDADVVPDPADTVSSNGASRNLSATSASEPPLLAVSAEPARSIPRETLASVAVSGDHAGDPIREAWRSWAVTEILEDLEVQPLAGTSVLSLQFTAQDDRDALVMMNAVIASYREFLQHRDQTSHRETIGVLAEREKTLRDELKRLQTVYESLHRQSPLLGRDATAAETQRATLARLGELLSTTKQRRIQLENYRTELAGLQNRAVEAESLVGAPLPLNRATTLIRMPQVDALAESSAAGLTDSPAAKPSTGEISADSSNGVEQRAAADLLSRMSREGIVSFEDPLLLQRSLSEALVREAELGQKFGPKHPDMRAVRGLIQSLRDRLNQTVRDAPAMVERELVAVREHETGLEKAYQEEFQRMKEVDNVLLKEEQVLAEIQRVQQVHATLMTQLNQSELSDEAAAGGRASIGVRVLDGPTVDTSKTWPKPVPMLAISVVIGMCGGALFISAGERWERQGPLRRDASRRRPT